MQEKLLSVIRRVAEKTDKRLWETYDFGVRRQYGLIDPGVIFPKDRDKRHKPLRISEQEARFTFAANLPKAKLLFSPETPTERGYRQKARGMRRASVDLTVYDRSGTPALNIEFKAHGKSTEVKDPLPIRKDIVKLVNESLDGFWFHVLEGVDRKTIPKLLATFRRDFLCVVRKSSLKYINKIIAFHILVLREKFSIHKELHLNTKEDWEVTVRTFFAFDYVVSKKRLQEVRNPNGWDIREFKKDV